MNNNLIYENIPHYLLSAPTYEEIKLISRRIEYHGNKMIKRSNKKIFICSIIATIAFISFIFKITEYSSLGIVISLILFINVILACNSRNKIKKMIIGFNNGKFYVVHGVVKKSERIVKNLNNKKIWFMTEDNIFDIGWYKVRSEEIKIGDKVILIVPNVPESIKKSYVFTEYMLSDKGYKHI